MKKIAFRFLSVLMIVFIFMATMEVCARAYFHFTNQDAVRIRGNHHYLVSHDMTRKWVLHPAYAYVSSSTDANNLGFLSPYNYPYQRQKNDFVIGVFGGSVADFMARKAGELGIDGIFKDQIPALRDKNVIFLNFAAPGGKQPMQFQRFSRFAEDIDFAVSIEGFNEVAQNERGAEIISPTKVSTIYSEAYAISSSSLYGQHLLKLTDYLIQGMMSSPFYSSSSALVLSTATLVNQRARFFKMLQQEYAELAKSPQSKLFPYEHDTRDLSMLGALNWAYYSRLQLSVSKELKVPVLFVIQPNRWVKNSKPLTQEEMDVEKDADISPTAKEWVSGSDDVTRGYKELSRQVLALQKKDPQNFLDLSFLFKDHHETIYSDLCCHMNDVGYKLIWSEIAKISAKRL
jgi:hypothetical protein